MTEPRPITCVGWDGRSQPMYRYTDELHLPDHERTVAHPGAAQPVHQILVTLDDKRQIIIQQNAGRVVVKQRRRVGDSWGPSLPEAKDSNPHEPGTYYIGEY